MVNTNLFVRRGERAVNLPPLLSHVVDEVVIDRVRKIASLTR